MTVHLIILYMQQPTASPQKYAAGCVGVCSRLQLQSQQAATGYAAGCMKKGGREKLYVNDFR